jgi:hypothetical protein
VVQAGLGNSVNISETGNINAFYVNQGGVSNQVAITQKGALNRADTFQDAATSVSKITINQDSGATGGTAPYLNWAQGFQQSVDHATIDMTQKGSTNYALVSQFNGTGSVAKTSQTGTGVSPNAIYAYQGGNFETATLTQYGNSNFIYGQQYGSGNTATVDQGSSSVSVSSNQAYYFQNGVNNQATISQQTSGNIASATQIGTNNLITITQH